ncbi:hypothetical protein CP532_4675 [Ophiocordyceps camponoti-leonardi (nom. inval.)]|nr:hypothetical protein CP532_4675 [Ophiocordyceps camponoti-leonardi (nom. inval.)]
MADQVSARFTPQNKTTHERLSNHTVGLVALSDFRKRRAEVLEQQEREAREAALAGTSSSAVASAAESENLASGGESSSAPAKRKKKEKKVTHRGKNLLSFGGDDDDVEGEPSSTDDKPTSTDESAAREEARLKANAAVGIVPRPVTKAALRKEATEREALRLEFLSLQEAVKATEVAIPFVFYDGAHIPGGTVRLKKGDFVWVFLDRCRKVGVGRKVGEHGQHHHHHHHHHHNHHRRGWARAGVDDLMLVRDTIIIPHHYDFYYFVMNKILGPSGDRLFDYSADAPPESDASHSEGLAPTPSKATTTDISTLEGATDDPRRTKVVDRRWYARNKHIYPASTWQEFDAERDYANEIRKDTGGNTFFFAS